ncbi:MAG: L-seryl-tRNA(Sec) selenium transferase [Anaerolineae bacterium]|nr:L-seryl-tRNA(Sec) selenium transferase [Anaerolineae bacterium]
MSTSTNSQTTNSLLRALPSVDVLITSAGGAALAARYGRAAALDALRAALDSARASLLDGAEIPADAGALLDAAAAALHRVFRPSLRPVINATGIILHTNLGRAPLSESAQRAMLDVAANYSTLEFDLDSGKRGSRLLHPEAALCAVTGAEAALVVNNNAAALLLILSAFAHGREVIISRGQLVEIGGGFRIPDVLLQSGAKLVEVGTTNRTRPADYQRAVTPETALILRAHASNFKQIGFVESAPLDALAQIAHKHNLLLVDDLGSGTLIDTTRYGLAYEPLVQDSLAAGVDLVAFSGDKLLGGPQAGIILGKKPLIHALKRHALARAIRADKLCLAALVATLDHYRRGDAAEHIPIWRMIARPLPEIQALAESWAQALDGAVIPGESAVGGGSLPGATLPTALLALDVPGADAFCAALRAGDLPVIARIRDGRVLLDPRTVLPGQEDELLAALRRALSSTLALDSKDSS